ncbi:MAG TPA: hypothetical protein DHW63_00120 [Hyphomonadaceae bacterium]|nr:hypothetical protein [Hyphomonadaceae bacterium]
MLRRMMASALALTGIAYAQEAPAPTAPGADCTPMPTCAASVSGRVSYDTAFFAQFNPQNALDMVRQTPGFSLDGGDDRRGFSGAVGNLLIDGVRPTSKSQSLENILSRIPASQVVRVEVLRGAEVAGDASGQAQLVNVVRTPSAGSGIWRIGGEHYREGMNPQGELSWSGRRGQFEYGVGVDYYSQGRDQPGNRRYEFASGALEKTADTPGPARQFREGSLNANAAFPLLGGRLSANGQYYANRFHGLSDFFYFDPVGAELDTEFDNLTEKENNFELGVNYDRDFGPWTLALVGLHNRDRYRNTEAFSSRDSAGALNFAFDQNIDNLSRESIARGALSRSLGQHRLEFGAEAALNSLDAELVLTLDDGTGPVVQPLDNSNVLVEEERAEAFIVHTWRANDEWSIETRLAGEQSTLTFTGPTTNQSVELAFFKPSVQISRSFGERNQARLRLYRDVGQLDFNDFVSAAGLTEGRIEGGNPDLRPQIDLRAELGADLRFPGDAALNLTLTRHWYEDVADLVKLIDTGSTPSTADDVPFDAPGNIGEADAWSLDANLTLPLRFLLPGAQITVAGEFWQTEVTDPITGNIRDFSSRPESEVEIEFRQDLTSPRMAWGVSLYKEGENTGFRFNETDTYEEGPWIDVFVETTAIEGLRLRLVAANVANGEINRERRFYGPNDRADPLERVERRFRQFGHAPWFVVSVAGSF